MPGVNKDHQSPIVFDVPFKSVLAPAGGGWGVGATGVAVPPATCSKSSMESSDSCFSSFLLMWFFFSLSPV